MLIIFFPGIYAHMALWVMICNKFIQSQQGVDAKANQPKGGVVKDSQKLMTRLLASLSNVLSKKPKKRDSTKTMAMAVTITIVTAVTMMSMMSMIQLLKRRVRKEKEVPMGILSLQHLPLLERNHLENHMKGSYH